jgi:DNA-binding NarL/FixJ family response regulator
MTASTPIPRIPKRVSARGSSPIKLLLVDDHEIILTGLRIRFGIEPDFNVVGVATDGPTAVKQAELLQPDVIVMDVLMPHMNGITAAHLMNKVAPDSAIVLMSLIDSEQIQQQAHDAGASAFICKHGRTDLLLSAIRDAVA